NRDDPTREDRMSPVITAPTDAPELLAPIAGAPAPGRVPAGAFDILMALLQTQVAPSPTTATPKSLVPLTGTAAVGTPAELVAEDAGTTPAAPTPLLTAAVATTRRMPG